MLYATSIKPAGWQRSALGRRVLISKRNYGRTGSRSVIIRNPLNIRAWVVGLQRGPRASSPLAMGGSNPYSRAEKSRRPPEELHFQRCLLLPRDLTCVSLSWARRDDWASSPKRLCASVLYPRPNPFMA